MIHEIKVPPAGESVTEADIAEWKIEDGAIVAMDEAVCELETDKASQDMYSPVAGRITILVEAEETVLVGQVIATVDDSAAGSEPIASAAAAVIPSAPAEAAPAKADALPSPAARKLMSENIVSAQDIHASGKDGRITKGDVVDHLAMREKELSLSSTVSGTAAVLDTIASPATSTLHPETFSEVNRATRVKKMSRLRRTIATRLVEAQKTAAILTTFNEIDMGDLMDLRKAYKEKFKERHDVGLGFMSFFSKAASMALMDFPIMNARVDGSNIVYHDYVDLGIAVSTPKGLVVPVVRDTQEKGLADIEKNILALALKGRAGNITADDMEGGTFTITNGGTFGSMMSTPILNSPQSAILGMHNIVKRPVVYKGEIAIRPIMYVACSYDHRIIDGSDAVRFLVRIKELIEDPARLLLDV